RGLSLTPGREAFHSMDAAGPDHLICPARAGPLSCLGRPAAHRDFEVRQTVRRVLPWSPSSNGQTASVPIGRSDYGDPPGAAVMFFIILAGLIVCGSGAHL